MLSEMTLFDEGFYLAKNSDVAVAVASGIFSSAAQHFFTFGEQEKRDPSAFFQTEYYLSENPDVAAAISPNLTAFDHFINVGYREGRDPTRFFNTNFYAQTNPDVAEAVQQDPLTGFFAHFITVGAQEGRTPVAFFDPTFYLEQNPDVAEGVSRGETTAIAHFANFGQSEGRLPRRLFNEMYVFGDSLSDDGNLFALTLGIFPPEPLYANGRFSNGPVWSELLPSRLGLEVNPQTNIAFGGATTSDVNSGNLENPLLPPLPGLETQIESFLAQTPFSNPNGLYAIWAGSNDYLNAGITDVNIPVNNLVNAVTELAEDGARNFMVMNLPDLGNNPGVRDRGPQAQQFLTQLSNAHNTALAAAMANLDQNPNINIILVDINGLINDVFANPTQYGLTNVTDAAFESPGSNPNTFLFWDEVHPTTASHQIITDEALKTVTDLSQLVKVIL
ncbi:SGNH/GDSL hydrolase family protein [Laspinema olomoucense]|uniref:SGNH/GDSL hydrolase family protein n=1 Tax=Laspinema olomoucense D3b TaxID=2953688 RepID=A0ABT2N3Q4_9CYAN|nr:MULTISPECIES: SGNH/GDSL hydrolase family protein [unclassified Laspinema]MCT7977323.1 SGNH/GDSL hydrolase family protein [Laspinema sp. D3b]MCT7990788.1 SGNH/GDSL hydrolase family protein [Laspinema sp. D3a]